MNIKKDTIYTNKAGRVKGAGHPGHWSPSCIHHVLIRVGMINYTLFLWSEFNPCIKHIKE